MARTDTKRGGGRGARTSATAPPASVDGDVALTPAQKLELYYWMRLTRSLEERLVNLYRQTKVVGGLFRSLGQEADAVGSAFALERRDVLSPLIRNLGSMLVKGATPLEILKQYMAKGDSPTRGRELNIHFGDTERGFIGQISPLGATSTGAFHEGINFAAVQRCPLVVVVENNGYAYSTPTSKQTLARQFIDKAIGYGIAADQADGNDVIATYEATKRAVDRARRGEGVTLVELITYRRKGHAEHDNQSYVPAGEIERWERENDPLARYVVRLVAEGVASDTLAELDARVVREIDEATDAAELSGVPEPLDALVGVYADPPAERPLWFREGLRAVVDTNERPEGWGTFDAPAKGSD
jgi:TPP-dependent pyruvate/acetoin dehydrogenase alpha subunit